MKIRQYLPELSKKNKRGTFFIAHGIYSVTNGSHKMAALILCVSDVNVLYAVLCCTLYR